MGATVQIEVRAAHDGSKRPLVEFTGEHGEAGRQRRCRILDGGPGKDVPFFVLEVPRRGHWGWRALGVALGALAGFATMPLLFETMLGMTPHAVRESIWATLIPVVILSTTALGAWTGWRLSRRDGVWLAGVGPWAELESFTVRESLPLTIDNRAGTTGASTRILRADFTGGHPSIELLWTMAPLREVQALADRLTEMFVRTRPADPEHTEMGGKPDDREHASGDHAAGTQQRSDIPQRLD
jgi:hypothetical protein